MWNLLFTADTVEEVKDVEESTAAFCLRLPGKTLFLSHLLALKKFRKKGNKDGALRAFYKLEEELRAWQCSRSCFCKGLTKSKCSQISSKVAMNLSFLAI
jgi:hypothetical protein